MMKGIVILSGTSAQITTDYRLFMTTLISHSVSKGYRRWPGFPENMELLKNVVWDTTQPDRSKYAQIMVTKVKGNNSVAIQKQEWIIMNCARNWNLKRVTIMNCVRNLPQRQCFGNRVIHFMVLYMVNLVGMLSWRSWIQPIRTM